MFKFLPALLIPLMMSMPSRDKEKPEKMALLNKKITMSVHAAETLESVLYRLGQHAGIQVKYSTLELAPYKARKQEYMTIPVREILSEQLSGTLMKYKIEGNKLIVYKDGFKNKDQL